MVWHQIRPTAACKSVSVRLPQNEKLKIAGLTRTAAVFQEEFVRKTD